MKKYLRKIWGILLKMYDSLTAKVVEVSIGDIILKSPLPDFILFLVASRYLDAKNYVTGEDLSFKYMNGISAKAHGSKHSPKRGNKQFKDLIESFQEKGYDPKSLLVMDKDLNLDNGTHRLALCLLNGIYTVKAKVIKRKALATRTVDWYFNGDVLDSTFLKEINDEYKEIMNCLVKSGNAFLCSIQGEVSSIIGAIKCDIEVLCGCPVEIMEQTPNSVIYSFAITNPKYRVGGGRLLSLRAAEIEKILIKRYQGKDVSISVSRNCIR